MKRVYSKPVVDIYIITPAERIAASCSQASEWVSPNWIQFNKFNNYDCYETGETNDQAYNLS